MKLVFATNNHHKLSEIQNMLGNEFQVLSLADINCQDEIPEDHETLEENASQKAHYIYEKFGLNCFADDTGLEVTALNNEPGVYSARYAGSSRSSEDNMKKVLQNLDGKSERSARFRTVIALIIDGEETQFEGIVSGDILYEEKGKDGFGYDPIFQPNSYDISFAEMSLSEKNKISHRGNAVRKLVEFLLK
ncbi:non-canonical purine NTP diphosphatase [Ancylomarina euxinus]|uniref:dITP/XTP pyrophosphatase n=1 Tax=Ancylomarina euxinus TaxID=2283627 RepID=A0A425Y8K7_9BACT|nr:non-canonical purine NTP diphosphatase [Ancylomarina euxinus]MCZ4693479.1 non-canonical purine NTP diphosphatase [Ancylomarina euxinus]MUP13706.1 non-canonical purine NTP diphosphatase [Ancylomarina euxinus]RRG24654.1 non-canonical purine NTP diphosphatase [Ancylomarina euxinus]